LVARDRLATLGWGNICSWIALTGQIKPGVHNNRTMVASAVIDNYALCFQNDGMRNA
jgi:hypothetical protein